MFFIASHKRKAMLTLLNDRISNFHLVWCGALIGLLLLNNSKPLRTFRGCVIWGAKFSSVLFNTAREM